MSSRLNVAVASRYAGIIPSVLFVFCVLTVLVGAGFSLEMLVPRDPAVADPSLAAEFIFPTALRPKPHDRQLFPLVLIAGSILLCLAAFLLRVIRARPVDPRAGFAVVFSVAVGLALWWGDGRGFLRLFSQPNLASSLVCLAIAAFSAWVSIAFNRGATLWAIVACLATTVLALGTRVYTSAMIDYQPQMTSHYEAAVFSIVHIAGGGTCLADVPTQYGCYGEFLAPILWITGASTLAVTSILAALYIVATCAIILFARRIIHTTALFLAAVICVTVLANIVYMVGSTDPYYQYNPICLFFPALSLLFVLAIQKQQTPRNLLLTGMFAGAALAWNLDTGLAVFGALAFFVFAAGAELPASHRMLQRFVRLARFSSGAMLFLLVFAVYLGLKSGWHVNIVDAIAYQKTFYVAGLAMLPIPPFPDYWTLAALVTSTALLIFATQFATAAADENWERAAYLAILGIGLFLYYTGRSHVFVLRFVVWPDVLLFFFLTDQFVLMTRSRVVKVVAVTLLVALPLAIVGSYFAIWSKVMANTHLIAPDARRLQEDIAFIRSHTRPGEAIGIVAENQATLYGETGTWPQVAGASLAELLRISDRDRI